MSHQLHASSNSAANATYLHGAAAAIMHAPPSPAGLSHHAPVPHVAANVQLPTASDHFYSSPPPAHLGSPLTPPPPAQLQHHPALFFASQAQFCQPPPSSIATQPPSYLLANGERSATVPAPAGLLPPPLPPLPQPSLPEPLEVGTDVTRIPPALVSMLLDGDFIDPRLLTDAYLSQMHMHADRSSIIRLLKKPVSKEPVPAITPAQWWEAFHVLQAAYTSLPGMELACKRLSIYAIHISRKASRYPAWIEYDCDFRSRYRVTAPASPDWYLAASACPLFSSKFAGVTITAPRSGPSSTSSTAKRQVCFAWNSGRCERGARCKYAHICRVDGCNSSSHVAASCPLIGKQLADEDRTASRRGSAPQHHYHDQPRWNRDAPHDSYRKRPRNCESPICPSLFHLPSPYEVCSFNIPAIRCYSKFLGGSALRESVLTGLSGGFSLMFRGSHLRPCFTNSPSALANPSVVDSILEKEVTEGAMAGPFPRPPIPGMQCSRFSILQKPDKSGWRLLFDLSYPRGFSVNDGISHEDSSVSYSKLSDVCDEIIKVGKGALLCKFDISRAYRHVPVSRVDRRLLGLSWNGNFYVDLTLSFGGRSCCAIFNKVGDLFTLIFNDLVSHITFWHYLDDFIGVCQIDAPGYPALIARQFATTLDACASMGIPLASSKTVGPTTKLTYLGFELDTIEMTISLPKVKRDAYIEAISAVQGKRSVVKKTLESLLGKLHHASTVIYVGRAFMRSLVNKVSRLPHPNSFVSLSKAERLNLQWWVRLLTSWNGVTLLDYCDWEQVHDFWIASDAAKTEGLGIVHGNSWAYASWPTNAPSNIAVLEMIALVVGAFLWGHLWKGKSVLFHTDSAAAMFSAESQLPSDLHLAALVRELAILSVTSGFKFKVIHVPGKSNVLPDLLSRGRLDRFRVLRPSADSLPTPIPGDLLVRLCNLVSSA